MRFRIGYSTAFGCIGGALLVWWFAGSDQGTSREKPPADPSIVPAARRES